MVDELYVERDDALIQSSVNRAFDELLLMPERDFREWAKSMRAEVAKLWRDKGVPPISGFKIEDIESQFRAMSRYDVGHLLVTDDLTGAQDCIIATGKIGSACRAFFPNMGKTKDIASEGQSQWDFFTDPTLFEPFLKNVRRHFKQDGFYAFSRPIYWITPGREWLELKLQRVARGEDDGKDFWLQALDYSRKPTAGDARNSASEKERKRKRWDLRTCTVSKKELEELRARDTIPQRYLTRIEFNGRDAKAKGVRTFSFEDAKPSRLFLIREYKKGQRIFPKGFRFFQAGLVLSGTNFPPLVAKYLYRRFTEDIKEQERIIVYDPSAGFGGRLLGALSASADRRIHYVGTDPNPDNWLEDVGMSRYEVLARFYHRDVNQAHQTTYEFFKLGSEVRHDARFKKYQGTLDLVFTSPPYFRAESYSDDENQSDKKFPLYDQWRDGFLRPTFETAVEWLKPGRPLIWNIADTKISGTYAPLEYDSKTILADLGMRYETKLKYVLSHSPGANRLDREGIPETTNFCIIGGSYRKYEPIFVYRKPG
jgi:hypothetical protein